MKALENHQKRICLDLNSLKTIKKPVVYKTGPLNAIFRAQPVAKDLIQPASRLYDSARLSLDTRNRLERLLTIKSNVQNENDNERVIVKTKSAQLSTSQDTSYDEIELYIVPSNCYGFKDSKFIELNNFVLDNIKNS